MPLICHEYYESPERCALRVQTFMLGLSVLIVNRCIGVFQFPLPEGNEMCVCDLYECYVATLSESGFSGGLAEEIFSRD